MLHDNTWRPSENNRRCWAPYNRAKLKHYKWHTPEEASAIDKEYNNWRRRWKGCFNAYNEPDWHLERKLIHQYIDKPFDELLKEWHDRTAMLRRRGVAMEFHQIDPHMTDTPDNWNECYVDMDGIIRRNPGWRQIRHRKPIKVIEKEVVEYIIQSDIWNKDWPYSCEHRGLVDVLRKFLKVNEFKAILEGPISEERFLAIKHRLEYTGIRTAIYEYRKKYNETHWLGRRCDFSKHCSYDQFEDLFIRDTSKSIYKFLQPGTKEYKKYYAEQNQYNRRAYKEARKQRKLMEESLLHDIEENRKLKEQEENSQKITKHGFSETESFRGEEYHGQKRKRKPRHNNVDNELWMNLQDTIEKTW